MKTTVMPILIVLLGLGAVVPSPAQDEAQDHSHDEMHAAGALDLRKPESGKWASDESLRRGMSELRDAFDRHHGEFKVGEFDSGDAALLADQAEEQVRFMFANCALPPEADAELHKLLAATLGAARTLRQSDEPHLGLHRLHQVLQAYPKYFEHPGWRH